MDKQLSFIPTYTELETRLAELESQLNTYKRRYDRLFGVIEIQNHTIKGLEGHNTIDPQKRAVDQYKIANLEHRLNEILIYCNKPDEHSIDDIRAIAEQALESKES